MGLLARLFSRQPAQLYDVTAGDEFEVAGVAHHLESFARLYGHQDEPLTKSVSVALVPEPTNRYDANAVAVQLRDQLVGYLPREIAAGWAAYLAGQERAGRRATVKGSLWYRWDGGHEQPYVFLRIRMVDRAEQLEAARARAAAYWTAVAEAPARRAAKEAERAAKAAERDQARQARAEKERQAALWRSAGRCVECGAPLPERHGRGRPPARCPDCLAKTRGQQ